ncbi:MAG: hypothetical protein K8R90_09765 [Candidatus Cloacimonetes bacterium]|nr:hypothetical protein [Candidatus Cloacimonadota bacterium]
MRTFLLALLCSLVLVTVVSCFDSSSSDGYTGKIVPIDEGWVWEYEYYVGEFLCGDSLWYEPCTGIQYDGIDDWRYVCWGANGGDYPAVATIDSVGYRIVWPEMTRAGEFDRYGRKLPSGVRDSVDVGMDYYLAKYPVAVGDGWSLFPDPSSYNWIECISLNATVTVNYGTFRAVHYQLAIEWPDETRYEDSYYRPGIGLLRTDCSEEQEREYRLVALHKNRAPRHPLAP